MFGGLMRAPVGPDGDRLKSRGRRLRMLPTFRPSPADPAAPALAMSGVTKRWPRQSEPVIDQVDVELEHGCVAWLGGANGAGKTTLMRIVAGLVSPDDGSVRVEGLHPERDRSAYQRRLTLLPAASVGLYARLTVAQHLDYGARLGYVPFADRRETIADALEAFDLAALADRRVDRMSMGQRQRVRLAMTFLPLPPLILLDEPRNSLDTAGFELLAAAVERATGAGSSVVWASPSGEETGVVLDRRFVIASGRLTEVRDEAVVP